MSLKGLKSCVVVQDMKRMTSQHQASLHEINWVERVRNGAGHKGDDQPAPSFLLE